MARKNMRAVGSRYEERTAAFLAEKGLVILERNYRCRLGEIDIIAKDGPVYVFCEVKYRRDGAAGDGAEAVDGRKQQRIFLTAACYLKERGLAQDTPCRFDVAAVSGAGDSCRIRWVRDAFGGF